MTSILDFTHTHWDASTILTDALVCSLYGAAALITVMMLRFQRLLDRRDHEALERKRAREAWEETPEGQAALRAEEIEMEQAAIRALLEYDWPQYVIEESP